MSQIAPATEGEAVTGHRKSSVIGSILIYARNLNTSLSGLRVNIPVSVTEFELLVYNFRRAIVWALACLLSYLPYTKGFHYVVVNVATEEIRSEKNFKLVELCFTLRSFYEIGIMFFHLCGQGSRYLRECIPGGTFECLLISLYFFVRGIDHHALEVLLVFIWLNYSFAFMLKDFMYMFIGRSDVIAVVYADKPGGVTVGNIISLWIAIPAIAHAVPCAVIVGYKIATHSLKDKPPIWTCCVTIAYPFVSFICRKAVLGIILPLFYSGIFSIEGLSDEEKKAESYKFVGLIAAAAEGLMGLVGAAMYENESVYYLGIKNNVAVTKLLLIRNII